MKVAKPGLGLVTGATRHRWWWGAHKPPPLVAGSNPSTAVPFPASIQYGTAQLRHGRVRCRPEPDALQRRVRLEPRLNNPAQERGDLVTLVIEQPVAVPDTEDFEGRAERARVHAARAPALLRLERAEVFLS